ncbi:MAG: hypothetical protein AAGD13_21185 [Pseudomonadota bacterium]
MAGIRIAASLVALLTVSAPQASAQDVQIWLDSGAIDIELENGEIVTLKEGEYLACESFVCDILPLAQAPAAPAIAQALGSAAPAAGGIAPGALGASAGTLVAAGVAGAAVVAAGVAIGVAAAGDSAISTTGTQ